MNIDWLASPVVLLLAAIVLGIARLARGPTLFDRIMAFDAIVTCAAAVVVVLSLAWRTAVFLELILIISSLGFFSTAAYAFYLARARPPDYVRQRQRQRRRQPAPPHD